MSTDADTAWFVKAFGRHYARVYAHRDEASAEREAAFVSKQLGLRDGRSVLDAGCGAGRHARALARTGARVTGVDLSAELLALAAERAPQVRTVRADLRALPFSSRSFDAIASLFTTFGYFDDEGNREQLAGFRRVVRDDGVLLLDFLNVPPVTDTLVPESERRQGEATIRERRRIRDGRVEKEVAFTLPGRETERWTESVRLYGRDELIDLARVCGFRVTETFGDLAGGSWSPSADRLVLRAEAA